MTDLHSQIMNIPWHGPKGTIRTNDYVAGHRDARHAAAELALAADARICQLEEALSALQRQPEPVVSILRGLVNHWNEFGPEHGLDEMMDAAHRYLAAVPSKEPS